MSEKIKVISMFNGRCGIDNSDLHISRRWPARGSYVAFDREVIEELMYDDAFRNMIENGTLFIDNLDLKKELGIEPLDAEKSTIILLNDKELDRFWKNMPVAQFKQEVKSLRKAQIDCLVDYAIAHPKDGDMSKIEILTKLSGRNVLKSIELQGTL